MEKVSRFDLILSVVVLGFMAPLGLFLFFWWGSVLCGVTDENVIGILAVSGLAVGLLADSTLLRRKLRGLFSLPPWPLIAVAGFYSLEIYGLSMGLPVLNSLVGVGLAYIIAKQKRYLNLTFEKSIHDAHRLEMISAGILFAACVGAALLALNEESIEEQLQQMLHLSFEVTRAMIWVLIVVGGCSLLAFQFVLSRVVYAAVVRKSRPTS